jgi:hypothetical protein
VKTVSRLRGNNEAKLWLRLHQQCHNGGHSCGPLATSWGTARAMYANSIVTMQQHSPDGQSSGRAPNCVRSTV